MSRDLTLSSIFPGRFPGIVRKGNAARDAMLWAEAAGYYQKALQLRPDHAGLWEQLGHMFKEDKQFANAERAYLRASSLQPNDANLQVQLGHFYATKGDHQEASSYYQKALANGSNDRHARNFLARSGVALPVLQGQGGLVIYFDYSDLIDYFRGNRFPTGIQRVQIELFKASLELAGGMPVRACAYSETARFWVELDQAQFQALCALAAVPGSADNPEWREAVAAFLVRHQQRPALAMPRGTILVNVGSSWWMPDYFSLIREAKARHGIRYVPLIYDLIPMITPEHLEPRLAWSFNAWISNVLMHADLLASISRCTQHDVVAAAKAVQPLPLPPVLMQLDAHFNGAVVQPTKMEQQWLLQRHGLSVGGYMLFVGTLEIRKNHLLVLQAWARLMTKHGAAAMPKLVCVGKPGWKFNQTLDFLASKPELADKVVILSHIADVELASLYDGCLATIYTSFYEGWGLPVTESLCRGKACLTANHSSLPEAGGIFADYYDPDSFSSFVEKLERLMFDAPYRASREALIAQKFRPRSWHDVLTSLLDGIASSFRNTEPSTALLAPVEAGTIYNFALDPKLRAPSRKAAVAELLRSERSWHPVDLDGMFANGPSGCLVFRVPDSLANADKAFVYLKVRASHEPVSLNVRLGTDGQINLDLRPGERRVIQMLLPLSPGGSGLDRPVTIHLDVNRMTEVATGSGHRQVGIGLEFFALCAVDDFETRLQVVEGNLAA